MKDMENREGNIMSKNCISLRRVCVHFNFPLSSASPDVQYVVWTQFIIIFFLRAFLHRTHIHIVFSKCLVSHKYRWNDSHTNTYLNCCQYSTHRSRKSLLLNNIILSDFLLFAFSSPSMLLCCNRFDQHHTPYRLSSILPFICVHFVEIGKSKSD